MKYMNSDGRFFDSVDSPPPQGMLVVEITDDQWQFALDNPGHTIINGVFTAPDPLIKRRRDQSAIIVQSFVNAINAPIDFNGRSFAANIDEHIQMFAALGRTVPADFYITALDGSNVPFTTDQFTAFRAALGERGWAAKVNRDNKLAAIAASKKPESVTW